MLRAPLLPTRLCAVHLPVSCPLSVFVKCDLSARPLLNKNKHWDMCVYHSSADHQWPAAFPLFGNQMYRNLGFQWATSLLAFLTVAMMPFPYIFYRYGKQIRSKCRYAKC